MEGFLWGLLAAYIAAIFFVAYDKPSFYLDHLDFPAFIVPIGAVSLMSLWNGGASAGFKAARDLIPADKLNAAYSQLSGTQASDTMFFICGGLFLVAALASFIAAKMKRYLAAS